MNTSIGRSISLNGFMNVYEYPRSFCASACAYAFLGGVVRSFTGDTVYGIHRFGSTKGAISGDDAQFISSIVAKYIESMDVDLAVFRLASETAFEGDIYWAPEAVAKQMRIIYDPTGLTSFVIEQRNGMIVASFKVATYTRHYEGIVTCSKGERLLVLFDNNGFVPALLRTAKNFPAAFDSPKGKIVGTATYVQTGSSRGMVFSLPSLDEGAFIGPGLTMSTIDSPELRPPTYAAVVQWIDAVSEFSFNMRVSNAANTLPIVLQGCERRR